MFSEDIDKLRQLSFWPLCRARQKTNGQFDLVGHAVLTKQGLIQSQQYYTTELMRLDRYTYTSRMQQNYIAVSKNCEIFILAITLATVDHFSNNSFTVMKVVVNVYAVAKISQFTAGYFNLGHTVHGGS